MQRLGGMKPSEVFVRKVSFLTLRMEAAVVGRIDRQPAPRKQFEAKAIGFSLVLVGECELRVQSWQL